MHLPPIAAVVLLVPLAAQAPAARPLAALPPAAEAAEPQENVVIERAAHAFSDRTRRVHFDRPSADAPLWVGSDAWKASFDGTGFSVHPFFGSHAPRNFPLRIELAHASVGGESLALPEGQPVQVGNSVHTARGALTEVVDTHVDDLEQSFVFATLPNRGAIAVDVRMHGEYAVTTLENGLRFANEWGHVDYTKAIAVDARGQHLPLPIVWDGDKAQMEIPASFVQSATLPIVLDPIINFWFLLGSGAPAGQLQHDSDVASFQRPSIGGRTLMIWQRQWSLTDQDCWGLMFDGNLGLVQTDFSIDFTAQDWLKVACAASNYDQNFLVVAEVREVLQHYIAGRTIAANAAQGAVFPIERDGVVGTPGNNFHPDVGCDPYFGPGRYTVVFNKKFLLASDIYMKQVTPAGGLVTTNAVALDTSSSEETKPTISKSCGQSNGQPATWLVTWQRTWQGLPNDQECWGRFVAWNGAVQGANPFAIAYTPAEETKPSPCSPIDLEGVRYWPVCYEIASSPGQPRSIVCRILRSDGSIANTSTVSSGIPGADDSDPEVDSDGTRFVMVYTQGGAREEQVTLAYLPSTNTLRTDSRTGLNTSSLDVNTQCNICADYSGGGAMSPRYFIAFSHTTTNTFHLVNFGGHVAGSTFTQRASYCTNLVPISATGSTVIGQTINISVDNGSPLAASLFGLPDSISLGVLGCGCLQGIAIGGIYGPSSFSWTVPNNPVYVGIDLSVQGFALGSECLNLFNMSNIVDFRVR